MQRLARGGSGSEHADLRLHAELRHVVGVELPGVELSLAFIGELRREIGGGGVAFDPACKVGGIEGREGEQQVGQVALDVDQDGGDAGAQGLFDHDGTTPWVVRWCAGT